MSAEKLAEALSRNPGRLVLDPTALYPDAFPHGGTEVGTVRDVVVRWGFRYMKQVSEYFGTTLDVYVTGQEPAIAFALQQRDPDTLPLLFPRVQTGAGPNGIPGMIRLEGIAGNSATNLKFPGKLVALPPLLFAALDPRNMSVLIRRPVALLEETADLAFHLERDGLFPVVCLCTPDSTGKAPYQIDLLEHLAL